MEQDLIGPFMLKSKPEHSSLFLDDKGILMIEFSRKERINIRILPRNAHLSDDEIFHYDDNELWNEIDGMFWNTYFERTWIQQEVAKAPSVQLYRGSCEISWPLFHSAFTGRLLLQFQAPRVRDGSTCPLQTLIDARERWRTPEYHTTLAGALVALAYSKETNKSDPIYAAYSMVKQSQYSEYERHAHATIEELMEQTARACIQERNNLYHLTLWCVARRNTRNLSTWIPDFTTGTCELACEYASMGISRLIDGSFEPCGKFLHLNCHSLDTVERTYDIGQSGDIEVIIKAIIDQEKSAQESAQPGLFEEYIVSREGWKARKSPIETRIGRSRRLSEARSIIQGIPGYPRVLLDLLWDDQELKEERQASAVCADSIVLEALWSLLNPESHVRVSRAAPPGECLFLAWLYLTSVLQQPKGHIELSGLPYVYPKCVRALVPVMFSSKTETISWVQSFVQSHLERTLISTHEPESVFVTSRGFLERTSADDARQGDTVSFLGGGWTPYILQQQPGYYQIKNFAYIEGLTELAALPANCKIERICLK